MFVLTRAEPIIYLSLSVVAAFRATFFLPVYKKCSRGLLHADCLFQKFRLLPPAWDAGVIFIRHFVCLSILLYILWGKNCVLLDV